MLCTADPGLDELASVEDAEELCRQLLASPGGWRSSTRRMESFLCEFDGPEEARRQARTDTNASVRKWRSPDGELSQTPSLLGT